MKYGLIAGGGSFPLLTLKAALAAGHTMAVVAVKEEAAPEVADLADSCQWVSLGQLSKLIDTFHAEGVSQAVMSGRIQHKRIFSAIRPDWRLLKVLNRLRRKNTDSLLGAVAQVLESEGISLLDSTHFLSSSLARGGPNGRRKPSRGELGDITYGREIARSLASFDIGQSVVICEQACVAVEAMEGTDLLLERAGGLSNGRRLTLVKVAKPDQDMRFDVPVIGPRTIRKMRATNATAVAVDARKTLLLERDRLLADADQAGIAVYGLTPAT
ncbi:MAG: UDP-2,3-diacylglucosamine diphosphatase LpxI [Bryobacterales bacterium]|nr:UDP-2,3-diacylglucosamine diphosphatase LpxI [Bryobacterales bacterium]